MRAAVVRAFGGPEQIEMSEVAVPAIGPDDVLVHVAAAGVNPVDAASRGGGGWSGIQVPYVPGSDASGTVVAVGAGVTDVEPGDEVFSFTDFLGVRCGSYAEYQAVPASALARKPAAVPHTEAAAVPLAAGTAFEVVRRRLALRVGERVAVLGAAGGVGGFAVQLALDAGAHVIAVSGAANHPYLRTLGAYEAYDHADPGAAEAILGAGGPVDAVADLVGGADTAWALDLLREGGRLATIQVFAGDLEAVTDRNLTVHGVLVRPDGPRLVEIAEMLGAGRLRVEIRERYPLEAAADAHRAIEFGHGRGKIVIEMNGR